MSRKFSKVFRGLNFPLGSEPTDCEPGDMFYDSVSGKFKAKESGDSVAKPVISSGGGAAPITAASFSALPDPTSLPLGTLGSVSSSVQTGLQVDGCGPTGNIYSMDPATGAPFYAKLDSEIVLVTGWTSGPSNEWALQRGQLGTTAAVHVTAAIYRVTKLIYTVTNALGAIHWA